MNNYSPKNVISTFPMKCKFCDLDPLTVYIRHSAYNCENCHVSFFLNENIINYYTIFMNFDNSRIYFDCYPSQNKTTI